MGAARCDVVVRAAGAAWQLAPCLEELRRCTEPALLGEVIVVDGSEGEASPVEEVCARHAVKLVRTAGAGLAGELNGGAATGAEEWLLLLEADCLITPGAIARLLAAAVQAPAIALASPLSSDGTALCLPMLGGRSYREMGRLLADAAGLPGARRVADAGALAGGCVLVRRSAWSSLGGLEPSASDGLASWAALHARVLQRGWRAVGAADAYVYRPGGGRAPGGEEAPVALARENLARLLAGGPPPVAPELLFVVPGFSRGVGGLQVVADTCNHLIRAGSEAAACVLGTLDREHLRQSGEPLLFAPLVHPDEGALLADRLLQPKAVAATHFTTAFGAAALASDRRVPSLSFVQGYEAYFDDGRHRAEVLEGYRLADEVVVTSRWLEEGVRRHLPLTPVTRLPIGVDPLLFHASPRPPGERLRIGCVLREARDKGQWVLLEALDRLADLPFDLTLLLARGQEPPGAWEQTGRLRIARLPLDRAAIAPLLRTCDLFLDASLHEGYGLLPLEAMASGAVVVASDSGGVGEFLRDGVNGVVVREVNQPGRFVDEIRALEADRARLGRLRAAGLETARDFSAEPLLDRWTPFVRRIAGSRRPPRLASTPAAIRPGPLQLRPAGEVPRLLLRGVPQGARRVLALRFDAEAPTRAQAVTRRGPLGRRGPHRPPALLLALARGALHSLAGPFGAAEGRTVELPSGEGVTYLDVPPTPLGDELVLALPGLSSTLGLAGLEVRATGADGASEARFAAGRPLWSWSPPESLGGRIRLLRELVAWPSFECELGAPVAGRWLRPTLDLDVAAGLLLRVQTAVGGSLAWHEVRKGAPAGRSSPALRLPSAATGRLQLVIEAPPGAVRLASADLAGPRAF